MVRKWFDHLTDVASIKAEYRRLAKQYHPDVGGDTATMQSINAQYHDALRRCNGETSKGSDNREHTYKYDRDVEQEVMDKLREILGIRGTFDVHMIGTWLWVMGDTKPIKDKLKALGCSWHSTRVCWYWRPAGARHYGKRSAAGLESLANKYGVSSFAGSEQDTKVVA